MWGGGSKKLSSVYNSVDGASKTDSKIYANINSSNKIIFEKKYTWAKYTWKYSGEIDYGATTSSSTNKIEEFSRYGGKMYRAWQVNDTNKRIDFLNEISYSFGTDYCTIDGCTMKAGSGNVTGTFPYGCSNGGGRTINVSGIVTNLGYDGTAAGAEITSIWIGQDDTYQTEVYVKDMYLVTRYKWIPDKVEYVTSTNRNAYTENNTTINVNSAYYYTSTTYFPYNSTYRFLG